jgi:hypothetical protein
MNKIFCPECDSELNPLYAFEKEGGEWRAQTHRLWHCPECGGYLTPAARFTGSGKRVLTRMQYSYNGNAHCDPDLTPSNGDREVGTPVLLPVGPSNRR